MKPHVPRKKLLSPFFGAAGLIWKADAWEIIGPATECWPLDGG